MMVLVYVKTLNTDKNELKGSCNACDIGGLAVSDGHGGEQTDSEKNATQERDMQFLQQAIQKFHGAGGSAHQLVKEQYDCIDLNKTSPRIAFNGSTAPKLSKVTKQSTKTKNKSNNNSISNNRSKDTLRMVPPRVDKALKQQNKEKIRNLRWSFDTYGINENSGSNHNGHNANKNSSRAISTSARRKTSGSGFRNETLISNEKSNKQRKNV